MTDDMKSVVLLTEKEVQELYKLNVKTLQRERFNKLTHSNTISSFVTICQRHFALNYLRLDLFQPRRRVLCFDRRNSGSLEGALGLDSGSIRNILIKNTTQNGCSCFFVDGYHIPADSERISNIGRSRT